MSKPLQAVDLFCGAGGTSTGLLAAAASLGRTVNLTAVNHWTTAINSHTLNHPTVKHICEPVENLWPPNVVPGRHLDLLCASCECTFHSNARGGGPCNEQSRSQPWQIVRWITDLHIDNVLMENVPEFQHWGPLNRRTLKPLKSKRGTFFKAFLKALSNHGYQVEWRIQNAADYGDATNRRRLILMATRTARPGLCWPEPSHGPGRAKPYKTAREIIDWNLKGKSIFDRKKALSPNTLKRIAAGLKIFGGEAAEPFLVILNGTTDRQINTTVRSADEPLGPIAGNGSHHGLVEPFLVNYHGQHKDQARRERVNRVDVPLPTVDCSNRLGLVEPFISHLTHHGSRRPHSVGEPLPTVTGAHRGELGLVQPICSGAVPAPILVQTDQTGAGGHCCQTIDTPLRTVVSKQNLGLVQPFVVKYYGTGRAHGVDQPLDTVTTKDRFLLVEPKTDRVIAELDILFRMLQPHELSAAHSFPADYKFTGTKGDQTKQVGNSVPVQLARAHALALLK